MSNRFCALEAVGGGEIRIGVEARAPDALAFCFANDGPAIPEADIERIFDPFFTRTERGTGLGLAIAARIAEGHRGFIEAENTGEKRGVRFVLVLPASA